MFEIDDRGLVWPALTRFEGERAFERYLERTRAKAEELDIYWRGGLGYATGDDDVIVVMGSMISDSQPPGLNPSITNVQELGVDEGDIVKQIGDFLIVLQDGRLYSTDLRPDGAPGLRFAARQNVYRSDDEDTWYDELLVFGRRLVVTGYSYDEDATEFSVLALEDDGSFTREAVFYMTSDDYYSADNYATRLVGDQLIIHTPIYVSGLSVWNPAVWPAVRRWRPEDEAGGRRDATRSVFDARDIYKPVQLTLRPVVHTFSVCPLGDALDGADLECRTTAVVAPERYEFYITTTDAWLWTWQGGGDLEEVIYEERAELGATARPVPAALFRIPLSGAAPWVLGVQGVPRNQFALDADEQEFRALVGDEFDYDPDSDSYKMRYFRTPLAQMSRVMSQAPENSYTDMPLSDTRWYENRFTDTHVVYAGQDGFGSYPPDDDEPDMTARLVAAPIASPEDAVVLNAPHSVMRIERAGPHAVVTGYRDASGLRVSTIDLRGAPEIADTALLPDRYESENRSHAFNSAIDSSGAGLIGVPTVSRVEDAARYWWMSDWSDVRFLAVDAQARLTPLGALRANPKIASEDVDCEVSCIDWYGNTRPIFTGGRIIGLAGVEIIEGEVQGETLAEIRRISMTGRPSTQVAATGTNAEK